MCTGYLAAGVGDHVCVALRTSSVNERLQRDFDAGTEVDGKDDDSSAVMFESICPSGKGASPQHATFLAGA